MLLTYENLADVLASSDNDFEGIRAKAEALTLKNFGKKVHFRGIIEFSNACEKDCYYCGIRKSAGIKRYCMPRQEIVEIAVQSCKQGLGSIVLQSGELSSKKAFDFIVDCVREIKKETRKVCPENKGIRITASIGELSKEQYEELFEIGVERYLLRIETTNKKLYNKLHPKGKKHSFENRIKCLQYLKDIGYQAGTGAMVGLPEQNMGDLASDLLFFKENDFDMFGLGPYIVHSGTQLGAQYSEKWVSKKPEIFKLSLRMISLLRLLVPDANIASTTALQAMHPNGREIGLLHGANIVMPNITPKKYRPLYLLYDDKPCINELQECPGCLSARVESIGRLPALFEFGDSPHFIKRKGDA